MFPVTPESVTAGLALLTLVDLFLAVWILVFPRSFLDQLHGASVESDLTLTRRTGGFWVGFTLMQGLALFFWSSYPGLLLLVAGVRFTECVADWILLSGTNSVTALGRMGYALSVPYTLGFGFWFLLQGLEYPLESLTMTIPPEVSLQLPAGGIYATLVFLLILDLARGVFAVGFPDSFHDGYHGRSRMDPTGLLRRAGGVWIGMALVDTAVLLFWAREPYLLLVVAGLRLTDVLPEWFHGWEEVDHRWRVRIRIGLLTVLNLSAAGVFLAAPGTYG